jgi:hypothetical protein
MLLLRILRFLHDAQPGDALALSTDACCEMRQGIWLQAERSLARRDLFIYCQNEVPRVVRHGGAAEVLRTAGELAERTGREVMS